MGSEYILFYFSVIEAHNQIRQSHNLSRLYSDRRLKNAAQMHYNRMARLNELSHEENIPGRRTVGDRARKTRYPFSTVGENIASGQMSVAQVMNGWMGSPAHRHNILNGTYRNIGVAVVQSTTGTNYWCVVFGRCRDH